MNYGLSRFGDGAGEGRCSRHFKVGCLKIISIRQKVQKEEAMAQKSGMLSVLTWPWPMATDL
jgi:hypothetical protein